MKKTIVITLCILALAACNHKSDTTGEALPKEVSVWSNGDIDRTDDASEKICVWENGDWTTDWMRKYVEYCRTNDRLFTDERIIDIWNTWGLAYIDNDAIPEMVLFCPGEAYGYKVLTIHNREVVEWRSWRCSASYISRSGLIENKDGSMGEYWDKVFELKGGVFKEIYNHTDKLYKAHDKIDDTTGADEYFCYFKEDSTLRIGFEEECEEYHNLKNDIYSSVGECIEFNAIESRLSSDLFEPDVQPTLPDGVNKITLTVR